MSAATLARRAFPWVAAAAWLGCGRPPVRPAVAPPSADGPFLVRDLGAGADVIRVSARGEARVADERHGAGPTVLARAQLDPGAMRALAEAAGRVPAGALGHPWTCDPPLAADERGVLWIFAGPGPATMTPYPARCPPPPLADLLGRLDALERTLRPTRPLTEPAEAAP